MKNIQDVLGVITKSNYFSPWENILLGSEAIEAWQDLLLHKEKENFYSKFGQTLYSHKVPFVIVTEYIDEVFRYLEDHTLDLHLIRNKIAEAFLREKLKFDILLIDIELEKELSDTIKEKRELINAHLYWMQLFIGTILGKSEMPELDSTRCHVGQWLTEGNVPTVDYTQINELHHNLHAMAKSAMRMYQRHDYAYFLLLYSDILMSSYQIRDLIMNVYFVKYIKSIYSDPLTGLGNYFQINKDIKDYQGKSTLLVFNIKEFSKINMLYGYQTGDRIINEIAEHLKSMKNIIRSYRIYGDEFAILFSSDEQNSVLKIFEQKIIQHSYSTQHSKIILSFYASFDKVNPHVLSNCEYGLMLSKQHRGHIINASDVDEKIRQKYLKNITLTQELQLAFLDNRIIPYFQPILDLKTDKVTKYETLMRVRDVNNKILEPIQFLEHLQGMYLYPEVTKMMIQKTFDMFRENEFDFSINLSFSDITNPETESFIHAILKQYPDTARRCTFELLEYEAILNQREVQDFLDLLRLYNVKIALDDFGVGYANYDTILNFDIDYIKIDGFITQSVLTKPKTLILMESIVALSKELDSKVIAEFIDSKILLEIVRKMGIDYAQGYYIGIPSPTLSS